MTVKKAKEEKIQVEDEFVAFEGFERLPPLPYEVLEYPTTLKVLSERTVNTRYGDRVVLDVEVLETGKPNFSKGKYSLWLSRLGLYRVFSKAGEKHGSLTGKIVQLQQLPKAGRAYNYRLKVLK